VADLIDSGESGARDLDWEGCFNARDAGGLPLAAGGMTPRRRVVRSDSPDRLSPTGWAAVWDYGVRTIIDLRREDECAVHVERPPGLTVHRVSWDEYPDEDWNARNVPPGLPGSMRAYLHDYPEALADAARILVDAAQGAVLVHCAGGRDRTGLFAIVLGALVGVKPEALFADYQYSFARLLPSHRQLGLQNEIDFLESEAKADYRAQVFAEAETVVHELDTESAAKVLLDGGLSERELDALRRRLIGAEVS
jgi:protein tyrosine/serine phosphatase